MKKFALLLPLLLFFASCDKVKNPIVGSTTVKGTNFIIKSNSTVANSKKMLLEDFTGQRCPNCPDAAAIIKNNLVPAYGSSLVVISIHQGGFATPFGTAWPRDYRTTVGDEWGSTGGFGITEWPTGIINRKNYNSNGLKLPRTKWTSVCPMAMTDPFVVRLDVVSEYDPTVRALNLRVKGTFKTAYANKINIVACMVEDSIIGKQTWGGDEIEDYEFEHMFRGTINGKAGDVFTSAAASAGDSIKWVKENYGLPKLSEKGEKGLALSDTHLSVIIYVYDLLSGEILQVEKVKIR